MTQLSAGGRRRRRMNTGDIQPKVDRVPTEGSVSSPNVRVHRKTWRTYVRWAARIALVLVLLLSSARVVRIPSSSDVASDTVLLVITHSRTDYLERCLAAIFDLNPTWDVLISRDRADGIHEQVDAVVERHLRNAKSIGINARTIAHEPDVDPGKDISGEDPDFIDHAAYHRISAHYRFALDAAFTDGVKRVVVLEDDMKPGVDFFTYFDALAPLLTQDDSLWCVSAWNDNGIPSLAVNATQLYRTDFFPGLGWMLTRELWDELRQRWPKVFWDDWMRDPAVARGRQCVRPEVSRVENFGERGASASFNFEKHVGQVRASNEAVDFTQLDVSYLRKEVFDEMVFKRMSNATRLRFSNYLTSRPRDEDVIAMFPRRRPMVIGKRTGVMTDHRHGIFRTSYRDVIIIPWNGHWAFLVAMDYKPPVGYTLGARECC